MKEQRTRIRTSGNTIVFGTFKAMGDLLCACPVIKAELDAGCNIHLLLFHNQALIEFVHLINFGINRDLLKIHTIPVKIDVKGFRDFLREMVNLDPGLVWISPHAPAPASSWKIPISLWLFRKTCWRGARLAGAVSERMSFLFDDRVPVDRDLPFIEREWRAFYEREGNVGRQSPNISFTERVSRFRDLPPVYDLLIHPGANAKNRSWPARNYSDVVRNLPPEFRIAVVGLPSDIEMMKASLPSDRDIEFLTGSLMDCLISIARSKVLLTMDSGNVHFARVLQVPAVALFGKSDPANVIPLDDCVAAIYEKRFPCQPCGKTYCTQPEVYCMNALSPDLVAEAVMRLWHRTSQAAVDKGLRVANSPYRILV